MAELSEPPPPHLRADPRYSHHPDSESTETDSRHSNGSALGEPVVIVTGPDHLHQNLPAANMGTILETSDPHQQSFARQPASPPAVPKRNPRRSLQETSRISQKWLLVNDALNSSPGQPNRSTSENTGAHRPVAFSHARSASTPIFLQSSQVTSKDLPPVPGQHLPVGYPQDPSYPHPAVEGQEDRTTLSSERRTRASLPIHISLPDWLSLPGSDSSGSRNSSLSGKSSRSLPMLTLDAAKTWRNRKKHGHKREKLPDDYQLKYFDGRDVVMFFDDSASMREHWIEVKELAEILVYMMKKYDDDGLDVYTTISRRKEKVRDAAALVRILDKVDPEGQSDFPGVLQEFIAPYLRSLNCQGKEHGLLRLHKRVKPLSIYVFTDGVWQSDSDATAAIRKITETLDARDYDRSQILFQFIGFGNDQEGSERLATLDWLNQINGLSMDIVDTIHWDRTVNLWKVLLGPTSVTWDGDRRAHDTMSVTSSVKS